MTMSKDRLPHVRFSRSLRFRLLLASIVVECIMLSLLVANGARLIRTHLMHNTEIRLQTQEASFNIALAALLAARDYGSVQSVLDGWGDIQGITYMAVTDTNGREVAAHGLRLTDPLPAADNGLHEDTKIYHGAFDVTYLGQKYGRAYYGLDTKFLQRAEGELVRQSIGIAVAEIALTLALLAGIGFWLTRHLSLLAQAALQVARGDFAVTFKAHGSDEVGVLSRAFDSMAQAVESRILELEDSNQSLRAIADYTYGWESWFDEQGHLRWVNPAVERITGYTPEDCAQMPDFPLPLIVEEDREDVRIHMAAAKAGTSGADVEFRVRHKDGTVQWVAMSWQAALDDKGSSLGFRTSMRDITDRKRGAEMLVQAKGDLERMLFAASHDLKEPVRNILIHLQRLERMLGDGLNEEAQSCLHLVRQGGTQLDLLVRGLLAFSSSDRPAAAFVPIDLGNVVRRVTDHLSSRAESLSPMFDVDRLPTLPGDPGLMFVLFEALIGNAVKFIGPDMRPAVRIFAQEENRNGMPGWRIDITDNGIGIAHEYLQSIFRPFSRLNPRSTYPGAGLGLISAQKIAAVHGGSIWLESQPGHGTTAHVWLPRPINDLDGEEAPQSPSLKR